jgi:ParB family chromosome partitioning protein
LRLPQDVRDMLARGELTAGHARTLITAEDPAALARQIVGSGLSVREAEALSQRGSAGGRSGGTGTANTAPEKDADTRALEKQLSDFLGMRVNISHAANGGRLEIRYRTLDQLDALCMKLSG